MASGDLSIIKYIAESTLGVVPAAALTKLAVQTFNVNPSITTTESAMISDKRFTLDLIQTGATSGGDMGIEWAHKQYNPFIESALGSTFSTPFTLTASDISAAASDNSINSVAAAFSTANILPGHWIVAKGFTGGNIVNNGKPMKVVSVTTAKIIVSGVTLVDDAAGESVTVKGSSIRNGTVRKSFTFEVEQPDLTTSFEQYNGQVVSTMALNASTGAVISGSFGLSGTTVVYGTTTCGTGADVAATINEVFNPTSSIGTVYVDGVALTGVCLKTVNLTTDNGVRTTQCLGSLYPSDVLLGELKATGTMNLYFNSFTLLNKFINAQTISLSYSFDDVAGNTMVVDIPRVKFSSGALSGLAKNSDRMVDLGFSATYDATAGYGIQISSIDA